MCKFNPSNDGRRIDPCIKNLIKFINEITGYETLACDCGHNRYPLTIVVKSKIDGNPIEILSKTNIPRKKKFYKRDKQGYYYIPEVSHSQITGKCQRED